MPGCGMRESDISGAQLTFFMHARLLWIRMNKEPEDPSLTWPPACTGIPVQNEFSSENFFYGIRHIEFLDTCMEY